MRKRSAEWTLVAVGLLVVAAVIVYQTVQTPTLDVVGRMPNTTQSQTAPKSRYAVNVNEATVEELMGVKHITQSMAQAIVRYRTQNGRFYAEAELLNVPGIGEKTLEQLLPYISIE